ncbi:MAG: hypothetical protein NXY57DRAFT_964290 [Lentinula lateritia]|nr:MAG: hypothetical protein NXY57DRAFT_964290 [Lentinula lateritia]
MRRGGMITPSDQFASGTSDPWLPNAALIARWRFSVLEECPLPVSQYSEERRYHNSFHSPRVPDVLRPFRSSDPYLPNTSLTALWSGSVPEEWLPPYVLGAFGRSNPSLPNASLIALWRSPVPEECSPHCQPVLRGEEVP